MSVLSRILPATDRPPAVVLRAALVLLLVFDAFLLLRLPEVPWVLAGLAALVGAAWVVMSLPWAVALLGMGYPILDPINIVLRTDAVTFYGTRWLVIGGLLLLLLIRVRKPGSFLARCMSDPIAMWAAALGFVLVLGLFWTPSPVYGRMKVVGYLITNLLLFAGGLVLATARDGEPPQARDERYDSFLRAIVFFALLLALAGFVNLQLRYYKFTTRLTVLGINPIWVARTMGLAILSLLTLRRLRQIGSPAFLLLTAPLAAVMVLTGSRGPLLGLLIVLVGGGLVLSRASFGRRILVLAASASAAGLAFLVMPEALRDRFLRTFTGETSGLLRIGLLKIVRSALAYVPGRGMGTGGFPLLLRIGDRRMYPHNLFAEIGIENGIPGLLTLVGFIGATLARGIRRAHDPRMLTAILAFIFALWNAQFSGDLIGNEWVWLFAGVIAGRSR